MTFRPPAEATGPGRTAIDVCDDAGEIVATIYGTPTGLKILCAPGHLPYDLSELRAPPGVNVAIRPDRAGRGARR